MLVDLCEESASIPYLLTWRKYGKRYITLLMNIVRAENKKIKVKTGKNGVIEGQLLFNDYSALVNSYLGLFVVIWKFLLQLITVH